MIWLAIQYSLGRQIIDPYVCRIIYYVMKILVAENLPKQKSWGIFILFIIEMECTRPVCSFFLSNFSFFFFSLSFL